MASSPMQSDVHVTFFADAVQNPAKSKEQGRPIFEDKEFVRIKFPGDRNRELVAPADQPSLRNPEDNTWLTYIDRFPAHYDAFKKGQEFFGEGTPIDEAPFLTVAQRAELKANNIHTIEAMAGCPDNNLSKLGMQARSWKSQSVAYLAKASGSAVETRMAAENAELREQMEAMRRQIAEMAQDRKSPGVEPEPVSGADFDTWSDEDLKAYIKDTTGAGPRGNPSHDTLVRLAEEANLRTEAD